MHALHDVAIQCPICTSWFWSRTLESTDEAVRAARTGTDFHEWTDGEDALPFRVHQCPDCGFAGMDEDFSREGATWAVVLCGDGECAASDGGVAGSEKYEAAARLAERRGDGPADVAELLLCAAWCCEAEGDTEAERYFRREAARGFERALACYDAVRREERARTTYLVGELWRRTGDDARAAAWLGLVAGEVTDPARQQWLVSLAAQQRDCPRDWLR